VDRTRRGVLAAAASLASLAGCAGDEAATATEPPTEQPPTATATPPPTATETPPPTATPAASTVRLWPKAVTTVFEGDVGADAVDDALGGIPGPAQVYRRNRADGTVTYFVTAAASFYVADAEEAFGAAAGLEVRRVYRGVGPRYRRQYASVLGEQVAEHAAVDASSVTLSPGRLGSHQFLDVSAPAPRSAIVPMLPELSFRRADGTERLVGPDGFAVDAGFLLVRSRRREGVVTVDLTLDADGIEAFGDAVAAASDEALRGEFFRPVVDGEALRTFGLSEAFATDIENGDWNGALTLSFAARTDGESTIARLTGGLPPVGVDCELSD